MTVPDHATKLVRREVRDILELKVFQSVDERAPVVEVEASAREIPLPAIERPLGVHETTPTLLLNVVQSAAESHPLAVVLACAIAFCLLLNVVQSVPVRRPVEVADAFQIAMVTFGPTVELAPFVMVMAELDVVKLPNVIADCLLLNVVQSVPVSAPVVVALAFQIENTPVVLL